MVLYNGVCCIYQINITVIGEGIWNTGGLGFDSRRLHQYCVFGVDTAFDAGTKETGDSREVTDVISTSNLIANDSNFYEDLALAA